MNIFTYEIYLLIIHFMFREFISDFVEIIEQKYLLINNSSQYLICIDFREFFFVLFSVYPTKYKKGLYKYLHAIMK